jgi:hypothetical protein
LLRLRAWWLDRQARRIGLEELDDLEDLFIRNTDSMVAYSTLGTALANFNLRSMRKRVARMIETDTRPQAHPYYRLYLAENLIAHGEREEAKTLLNEILPQFAETERLARAETLANLLTLERDEDSSWFSSPDPAEQERYLSRRSELFSILPSHLRFHDLALPVTLGTTAADTASGDLLGSITSSLLSKRFERVSPALQDKAGYTLALTAGPADADGRYPVSIHLLDRVSNRQLVVQTASLSSDGEGRASLINEFISKAFAHRSDPSGKAAPRVPILKGIL